MSEIATLLEAGPPLAVGSEYLLFGAAGLITLLAFSGLILAPALGAYGRTWEKFAAAFLSLFVLAALVALGVGVGVMIVYYWSDILELLGL